MSLLDGFKFWSPAWLAENMFTLYGGGKGKAPKAPDMSAVANATSHAADMAYKSASDQLAFDKQVYNENLPRVQQLYDMASNVSGQQAEAMRLNNQQANAQWDTYNAQYKPIEMQTILDSLGSQYLSADDIKSVTDMLTHPQYDTKDIHSTRQVGYWEDVPTTTTENTTATSQQDNANNYSNLGFYGVMGSPFRSAMNTVSGPITTNTSKTTTTMTPTQKWRTEDYVSGQEKTLNANYESQRAQAIDAMAKKAQQGAADQASIQAQAQSNSAFNQQAQALARMGLDPSRLASAAAGLAQQQTLANIGAANTARTNAANTQAGLRTGVANFGRNMPNTASQAFGVGGNLGNSAVGNMQTGANGILPYAQLQHSGYGSGIQAAGIQSQGALGLGNLKNSIYQGQLQASQNSGSMLGGLFGLGSSILGASSTPWWAV